VSAAILLIEAYRVLLRPVIGASCRFAPSCSQYAEEALRLHGMRAGTMLAIRRVARCHPWSEGGHDPVPREVGG
jgi:putative membrane protein insertion efficiency factor